VRLVNVVDLMALQPPSEHPHGLDDAAYDAIFPPGTPTVFAFHGYPQLVERLTFGRANHADLRVHGFREEGTTTTPFDMVVINGLDRFHLAEAAVARVPRLATGAAYVRQFLRDRLAAHRDYVERHGEDMPEIRDWGWPYGRRRGPATDGRPPSPHRRRHRTRGRVRALPFCRITTAVARPSAPSANVRVDRAARGGERRARDVGQGALPGRPAAARGAGRRRP
jgi:hypothetical protein